MNYIDLIFDFFTLDLQCCVRLGVGLRLAIVLMSTWARDVRGGIPSIIV